MTGWKKSITYIYILAEIIEWRCQFFNMIYLLPKNKLLLLKENIFKKMRESGERDGFRILVFPGNDLVRLLLLLLAGSLLDLEPLGLTQITENCRFLLVTIGERNSSFPSFWPSRSLVFFSFYFLLSGSQLWSLNN